MSDSSCVQIAFQLQDLVATAADGLQPYTDAVQSIVDNAAATVTASQASMLANVETTAASNVAPVADRMAALEALAADFQRQATVDAPVLIAKITASASQRIASEAANRLAATNTLTAVYSNILANANSGFASASTSRASIWAQMSNSRNTIVGAAGATLSVAVANEEARALVESASLASQISAATSASQSILTVSLTAEASRADAFCASSLASVGTGIPTDTTGTNDWQNW